MHSEGETLAPAQLQELRADLRDLLEPGGLIARLMIDFVCISSESRLAGAALLLTTGCVPLVPQLIVVVPLLYLALRRSAHCAALEILAPQALPLPPQRTAARAALANALRRIRVSTLAWP